MLRSEHADIICLLEADAGSLRNRFQSQILEIVRGLGLPFYKSFCKYGSESFWANAPIFRANQNSILSRKKGTIIPHYLKSGMKRLIEEYRIDGMSLFVVHLGLRKKARKKQLKGLTAILKKCARPAIVCGDFNILGGLKELDQFLKENGLKLIECKPSFPAARAKLRLDLFLASKGIRVRQSGVVHSELSDHLPVWIEIYD